MKNSLPTTENNQEQMKNQHILPEYMEFPEFIRYFSTK